MLCVDGELEISIDDKERQSEDKGESCVFLKYLGWEQGLKKGAALSGIELKSEYLREVFELT